MSSLPVYFEPFTHDRIAERLYVSRCMSCGLVVAGSPSEELLRFAERVHTCPVYLNYHGISLVP